MGKEEKDSDSPQRERERDRQTETGMQSRGYGWILISAHTKIQIRDYGQTMEGNLRDGEGKTEEN